MNNTLLFALLVGVICSSLWFWRTGWACGGFVLPGLAAWSLNQPEALAATAMAGLVLWGFLTVFGTFVPLVGRGRTSLALIAALALELGLSPWVPGGWVGWLVAGLFASDSHRQGLLPTLFSAVICTGATAATLMLWRWAAWS